MHFTALAVIAIQRPLPYFLLFLVNNDIMKMKRGNFNIAALLCTRRTARTMLKLTKDRAVNTMLIQILVHFYSLFGFSKPVPTDLIKTHL